MWGQYMLLIFWPLSRNSSRRKPGGGNGLKQGNQVFRGRGRLSSATWMKFQKKSEGRGGILKIYHIRQQIGFSQPCKITCEGYEAGKIRDDLLHRGTIKPRGGGWRKSGKCPRWLSNILLNTFLNLFMFQVNKIFDQPGRECTVP